MEEELTITVLEAYKDLTFLTNATFSGITHMFFHDQTAIEFQSSEVEIRLLHQGIVKVCHAMDVDTQYLYRDGLRELRDHWCNPPESGFAALEEIQGLLDKLHYILVIHPRDAIKPVPGYEAVFNGEFEEVLNHVVAFADSLRLNFTLADLEREAFEDMNPIPAVQGATDMDIDSLDVYTAGIDEEGECLICLEKFVEGQQLKLLPCSHTYHADCIDTWLRLSSTCPIDRFDPFPLL